MEPNKQKLIAKFAKKFAYKESKTDASVLAGAHYAKGGMVCITNRHYGLRIQNAHHLESSVTIHATKGIPIEGNYPSFDKVFPNSFGIEISLPAITEILGRVKYVTDVASSIDKKFPIVRLEVSDLGVVTLSAQTEDKAVNCTAEIALTDMKPARFKKRTLNAEYLLTSLGVFAEANVKEVFLQTNENPVSPIVISDGADIDVILLPYRTPE